MENEINDIINQIQPLFMRYGIKSITMGEISRELGISKKTLYKYFDNKADLVAKVVLKYSRENQNLMLSCIKDSENAIDEIITISNNVRKRLQQINPSNLYELSKYYREAWQTFNQYHKTFIENCIIKNLKKGIKEGLYRKDLDAAIIARIYISRLDSILDPLAFPANEFDFFKVHLEMMRYHIRGIASEKGIEYLKERMKREQTYY